MSKAAAIRFFSDNVGRAVDTVQVRPDGTGRWEPGPRTVALRTARTFRLDESTVEFTAAHRVTEVTGTSVTVQWTAPTDDGDDRVIHTTTYTLAPA